MTSQRAAIVTGATGYLGSCLVRYLANSNWRIGAIVRSSSVLPRALDSVNYSALQFDGSTLGLARLMEHFKPDTVFHLASYGSAEHSADDIERLVESNVLLGIQLLEAMLSSGVSRIVNTGTYWQHFENREFSPTSLYAALKKAYQDVLCYYTEAMEMRAVTLTLYDTYGAGDPRPKIVNLLLNGILRGDQLDLSPGDQLLHLVHERDVTRAYAAAADYLTAMKSPHHAEYVVDANSPVSIRELVHTLEQITGKSAKVRWGARPYRNREIMAPWTEGVRLPGWEPREHLKSSLTAIAMSMDVGPG